MSVSNEALSVQIEGLRELLVLVRDRDIASINNHLNEMNGRQRQLTEKVSLNTGNIQALKWRTEQVENDFKITINWRTLMVALLSTVQAIAAYFFSK